MFEYPQERYINDLKRENERLRKALEEIEDSYGWDDDSSAGVMRRIARKALEGEK